MVLFYVIATVLALGAAALLARPLLRRMSPRPAAAEYGQAVYRDQLTELDRDVARGLLSPQEEAAARAEIARRILSAQRAAERAEPPAASRPARGLAILALLVPLSAAGIYLAIGRPDAPDRPLTARLAAGETPAGPTELQGAIADVSERLRRNPNDQEARALMGRLMYRTGRYQEAWEHCAEALRLGGDAVETPVVSECAQARVLAAQGEVDLESANLFRRVLEADRANVDARFWLGMFMAQQGEEETAVRVWSELLRDIPPDSSMARILREQFGVFPSAARPQATEPDAGAAPDGQNDPASEPAPSD